MDKEGWDRVILFFVVFIWEVIISIKNERQGIWDKLILKKIMDEFIPHRSHHSWWLITYHSSLQPNTRVGEFIPHFHPSNQTQDEINSSLASGMTPSHLSLTLNQTHHNFNKLLAYCFNRWYNIDYLPNIGLATIHSTYFIRLLNRVLKFALHLLKHTIKEKSILLSWTIHVVHLSPSTKSWLVRFTPPNNSNWCNIFFSLHRSWIWSSKIFMIVVNTTTYVKNL
jgi:hypothetical protein